MVDNVVEEFVVTARKQDGFLNLGNKMYGYWASSGGSSGAGAGDIILKMSVSPEHKAAAEQALVNLAKTVAKLDKFIDSLPNNSEIQLSDGTLLSTSDLKHEWAYWTFNITDDNYGTNRNGGITYDSSTGMFVDNINYSELAGPNSFGDQSRYPNNAGVNFIILHELAHETLNGIEQYAIDWGAYVEAFHTHDSTFWFQNAGHFFQIDENYMNMIAVDIANYGGIDISGVDTTWVF